MSDVFESFTHQRADAYPKIYVFENPYDPRFQGMLCVGYTTKKDVEERIKDEFKNAPFKQWNVLYAESAMRDDGTSFLDYEVHRVLERKGFPALPSFSGSSSEWFKCSLKDVQAAIINVKRRSLDTGDRVFTFKMRPEQEQAVKVTKEYFVTEMQSKRTPKFLWNAKMRFGKTFAAYELAKAMDFKRILILTFKPAVESAWEEIIRDHVDFIGWQFFSRDLSLITGKTTSDLDPSKPIVCFGSFQDYLGVDTNTGGIKAKNEWVHTINWDMVIFDEYHFGAWRDNAKKLFQKTDEDSYDALDLNKYVKEEADNAYNETWLPITTNCYLFLSGTPFRSLNSGEFIEEQIFSWTYTDEQKAKLEWKPEEHKGESNPYISLPRMIMMTYQMPDDIQRIAVNSDTNEFDLNAFFAAKSGLPLEKSEFINKDEVQKWLKLIRNEYLPTTINMFKAAGNHKPVMPFSDARLLKILSHTLWFMPSVASCYAMRNLLAEPQNAFYHDYKVNVCAGSAAGIGMDAVTPVIQSMADPLNSKTITLSCGKLTTGVTIRPWSGIFMLRNLSSPETYFQAAFRVQSPWTMKLDNGETEVLKKECYIFDFALNRSLKQISDYSCSLNINESNPEKKVADFIHFLPVIAYDGSTMMEVNASQILDFAMSGTSATMLARKWESAILVNVDNLTLQRLLNNENALNAIMQIEGFRSLNEDIQMIINKSEHVKNTKKTSDSLNPEEKNKLTEEEKEYKKKRKEIQDKLIKFVARIPIFMYLTDFRENSIDDVITKLEPGLFKRVTGLTVTDFELLKSIGLFNNSEMNNAVYYFRRYEDKSLEYTGINKHSQDENVGLFTTTITRAEFDAMEQAQIASMRGTPLVSIIHDNYQGEDISTVTTETIVKKLDNHKPESEETGNVINDSHFIPEISIGDVVIHNKFGEGKV
jgi:hypothetical protein